MNSQLQISSNLMPDEPGNTPRSGRVPPRSAVPALSTTTCCSRWTPEEYVDELSTADLVEPHARRAGQYAEIGKSATQERSTSAEYHDLLFALDTGGIR